MQSKKLYDIIFLSEGMDNMIEDNIMGQRAKRGGLASYEFLNAKHLSNAEQKKRNMELFAEYQQDKEKIAQGLMKKSDSVARKALIEENLRLVTNMLKRYGLMSDDNIIEDLMQTGSIALMQAVDNYDPEKNKGQAPTTYMCISILRSVVREKYYMNIFENRMGECLSLDKPIGDDPEDDEDNMYFMIPSNHNVEEEVIRKYEIEESTKKVHDVMEQLPPNEKKVIQVLLNRYEKDSLHDPSINELCKAANISRQRLYMIKDNAFNDVKLLLKPTETWTDEDRSSYKIMLKRIKFQKVSNANKKIDEDIVNKYNSNGTQDKNIIDSESNEMDM